MPMLAWAFESICLTFMEVTMSVGYSATCGNQFEAIGASQFLWDQEWVATRDARELAAWTEMSKDGTCSDGQGWCEGLRLARGCSIIQPLGVTWLPDNAREWLVDTWLAGAAETSAQVLLPGAVDPYFLAREAKKAKKAALAGLSMDTRFAALAGLRGATA